MMEGVVTMVNHGERVKKALPDTEHIPGSSVILKQLYQEKSRSSS